MNELPNGVAEIAKLLADTTRGYGNELQQHTIAKFKADLMNALDRWRVIDPNVFEAALLAHGMRPEDAAVLVDNLRKRKAGKRLVPTQDREFKFSPPVTVFPPPIEF